MEATQIKVGSRYRFRGNEGVVTKIFGRGRNRQVKLAWVGASGVPTCVEVKIRRFAVEAEPAPEPEDDR